MSTHAKEAPEYTVDSIKWLSLQNKQSIVDLLMDVQCGNVSCRRAATEIQKQVPKKRLTLEQKEYVRKLRNKGEKIKDIAIRFRINPSTVWRICKHNKQHEARG